MSRRVIVTHDYSREFKTPLVAPEGTVLEVLRRNDGVYKEWFICRSSQGIEAYVPEKLLRINGNEGTLLADYNSWELTVKVGEILVRIEEIGGWVWAKKQEGEYGWVPSMNVKDYDRS